VSKLENLIEPIRHSPFFPQNVEVLPTQIDAERLLSQSFYAEMTPGQNVEFIDGGIVLHAHPRIRHLDVTLRVSKLRDAFAKLSTIGEVEVGKCLCVFPYQDDEPDIVFFSSEKVAPLTTETVKFPTPDLIVEVLSESQEHRERGVKFGDFAANDVGEYWIVDADDSYVELYKFFEGQYQLLVKAYSARIKSTVVNGFEPDIDVFFDDPKNLVALRQLLT